jgi:addiction module HigA family antidote
MTRPAKKLTPIHPGEILREDFLKPLNLSANRLALDIHVPVTRITDILRGRRAITADTALRLGRYFGTSVQFWLNLQRDHDIEVAEDRLRDRIALEVRPRAGQRMQYPREQVAR